MNEKLEPPLSIGQTNIPFSLFLDIIVPAFGEKATKQDIMACLKRAHWVVNLKQATYVRTADGSKEADVPLILHEDGETEFISEDGKKSIGLMRAGVRSPPEDWLLRRQWSHDLLAMILEKKMVPPRTTTIRGVSPFTGQRIHEEKKPQLPSSGRVCRIVDRTAELEKPEPSDMMSSQVRPAIAVKQEPGTYFPRLKRKHTAEVIQLDTPSPRRARPVGFAEDEHEFPDVGHDENE